jgi:flagellar biosynthetic protein FlhB
MAEESFQERTEEATPRRLEEARKKGQVAKSRELPSVAVLMAGLMTLFWGSDFFYRHFQGLFEFYLSNLRFSLSVDNMPTLFWLMLTQYLWFLGPFLFILFAVAFFANYLQIGLFFSTEALAPKFSKLNPFEGIKRLFSLSSWVELLKAILKVVIVGWVAFSIIAKELPRITPLLDQSPGQILLYTGNISFDIFWKSCLVMMFLAAMDYLFQRWEWQRSLKMTKQEVKEEYKQTEGDPQVKARIRSIQREMARRRMMQAVPEADVVITNPTHLAVALKYETGKMPAPMVVAKGAGVIAEKIKELASKHSVPVIENKPVAQALYKLVEVGQSIPESLYQAVAEILAYVYRLKNKRP